MGKEDKSLSDWINEHKVELIIAGIGITTFVFFYKSKKYSVLENVKLTPNKQIDNASIKPQIVCNKENIGEVEPNVLMTTDTTTIITRKPHDVSEHIRNLPAGHKPSPEKIIIANERGQELLPGQTFVQPYSTGKDAVQEID